MKMRTLLISLATLASSAALADGADIAISAGEHGEYSRIVITGGASDLAVETSGQTIRLRNIDDAARVSLADINDRQKAFRINRAKRVGEGAIELQMNCACMVRSLRAPDGKLVIDITEAPGPAVSATADKKPTVSAKPEPRKTTIDDTLTVAQAHDRMMDLLQKAADDGLIMMKGDQRASPAEVDPAASETEPTVLAPSIETTETKTAPPAPSTQAMRGKTPAEDSIRLGNPSPQPAPTVTASAHQCLDDHAFAIDGAIFAENPLVEIEALQSRIGETTGLEKEAVMRKLANGFLAIGFGEEALSVLRDKSDRSPALYSIAQAVAERPLDPNGVLLGAAACSGAHALWQSVATDGPDAVTLYERSGPYIETLPHRLRTLIATRLAVKMADLEAWAPAQSLLEVARGESEKLSPELQYVQTRLDDHDTSHDSSRQRLLEVATNESAASDEALFALAESYAETGGIPHDGFKEDIGALAKIGGSSRAAFFEAYSWAAAGNLNAAMLLLKNEAPKSPDNAEMASASASAMITRALSGDDTLLKTAALDAYLAHEEWIDPTKRQSELRVHAAEVAYDVGLPNLSFELLTNAKTATDRETSKKIAMAALAAGDPDAAIRFAASHATDPEFGAIVAEANIQKTNYHAALATAATTSDEKTRAKLKSRAGWLSRNWQAATDGFRNIDPNDFDTDAAIRYGLIAYMNGETSLPGAVEATLATQAETIKAGLNNLFLKAPDRPQLERARVLTNATAKELQAFEEILSDG